MGGQTLGPADSSTITLHPPDAYDSDGPTERASCTERGLVMDWRDQIESKPDVLCGKPCLRGTRLSVEHLVGLLALGWSTEDVIDAYPGLSKEDLFACLKFAAESVANEQLFPVGT